MSHNFICRKILLTCCGGHTFFLIIWARIWASMIWLFLMSPTRNIKHGSPSLWHITAFRENRRVCVRFLGRDSFANTIPTMNAWRITPVMDWIHITKIASGHSSVVCFEPYLTWKWIKIAIISNEFDYVLS